MAASFEEQFKQKRQFKMIENIHLANEGWYDSDGTTLDGLRTVNYVFGPNGSGKTTISRVIADGGKCPDCTVSWKDGTELERLVYNRDFVTDHFDAEGSIKGIYTFGENIEVAKEIDVLKGEQSLFEKDISALRKTLEGGTGTGGKLKESSDLDDRFKNDIWEAKKSLDDLKDAFSGAIKSKDSFRDRYLSEAKENNAVLKDADELRAAAATVFASDLTEEKILTPPNFSSVAKFEKNPILAKKVIGKEDVDIAELITRLGNSDWVQQGRQYFEKTEDVCPFCQQETPPAFRKELESYFDETYLADVRAIDQLLSDYRTEAERLLKEYGTIEGSTSRFLNKVAFEKELKILRVTLEANIASIERKKQNASTPVELEESGPVFEALTALFLAANDLASTNNDTLKNQATRKPELTSQIWKRLLEDTKIIFSGYSTANSGLTKAITSLNKRMETKKKELSTKIKQIEDKERQITSIKPTIDEINKLLNSFGFTNFHLAESIQNGFYEVHRHDGQDAKNTLSEGEKSFITFLYFYFLIKGSFGSSGATTDRIVVFDDPISSLDSDVLFIVCNLIKGVMNEMRCEENSVKQLIILTHNIYFHKEITFHKRKRKGGQSLGEKFWIIRKGLEKSEIKGFDINPVKSSYEMLWQEIRRNEPSSTVIQNVMRRILEHYFTFYGGIDPEDIIERFNGKEKMICGSLFSWINDGSHYTNDELYMSCTPDQVQKYLHVFQRIFEETDHGGHYKMMMVEDYVALPANIPAEAAAIIVEVANDGEAGAK